MHSQYKFKPQECPELHSSFLNQITFNWFTKLAWKGHRRPLERKDLWDLNDRDSSSRLNEEFEQYFIPEMKSKSYSIRKNVVLFRIPRKDQTF